MRVFGTYNTVDRVRLEHTLGIVALDTADDPACNHLTLTNNYVDDNGSHLPYISGE